MLLCIYFNDRTAFVFYTINVVCCTDFFSHVKPTLRFWDKSHLIMVYGCFHMFLKFKCFFFWWGFFAAIFLKHFYIVFLWYLLGFSNIGLIEWVGNFHFLKVFVKNWYYFFLKCLAVIWAWTFLCGKYFDYNFNVSNRIGCLFFLEWTLVIRIFQGICPFFKVVEFVDIKLFVVFPIPYL